MPNLTQPLTGPLARGVGEGGFGISLPVPTRFVSNSATGGYASGTDSGSGNTKAAPWATLTYALANATTGDVIEVNAGTYQAATFYNVTDKSLTIQCRSPGAVILQAANTQTRIINLNLASTSRTLTLINLMLDGRSDTTRGISLGGSTITLGVVAGLVVRNCSIKDCTTRYIEAPQQKSVNISIAGLAVSGSVAGRPFYVQDAQDGTVAISGMSFATTMTTSGTAGIEINRAAGSTGLAVSVAGVSGTLTASGITLANGIVIRNVDNALIQGCSLNLAGSTNNSGAIYRVFSDSATLSANNAVIRGNGGSNACDGGYCVIVGTDASGTGNNNHNNALVENNTLVGNPAAASFIHGIILGFGTGGTARNNTISGAGHGVVIKCQTGGTASGNTVSGFTSDGLYIKGSTNVTLSGNTVNINVAVANASLRIGVDDVTLANSTGGVVSGNTLNVNVNPPKIVELLGTTNDATFSENTYNVNATLGTSPAPWGYQVTGYNTLAAWKAAIEPTAHP